MVSRLSAASLIVVVLAICQAGKETPSEQAEGRLRLDLLDSALVESDGVVIGQPIRGTTVQHNNHPQGVKLLEVTHTFLGRERHRIVVVHSVSSPIEQDQVLVILTPIDLSAQLGEDAPPWAIGEEAFVLFEDDLWPVVDDQVFVPSAYLDPGNGIEEAASISIDEVRSAILEWRSANTPSITGRYWCARRDSWRVRTNLNLLQYSEQVADSAPTTSTLPPGEEVHLLAALDRLQEFPIRPPPFPRFKAPARHPGVYTVEAWCPDGKRTAILLGDPTYDEHPLGGVFLHIWECLPGTQKPLLELSR